jgi:hypothetical protein
MVELLLSDALSGVVGVDVDEEGSEESSAGFVVGHCGVLELESDELWLS